MQLKLQTTGVLLLSVALVLVTLGLCKYRKMREDFVTKEQRKALEIYTEGVKTILQDKIPDDFGQQMSKIFENNTTYINTTELSQAEEIANFTNMSGIKNTLLSDRVLKAALFASLFFLLNHKDMQPLLKKMVKNVPKSVNTLLHPAVVFGVLYYVLELFI